MVWSSWGKSWGGGTGTSKTIIADSFSVELQMEEVIFEQPQEVELSLDLSEFEVMQEDMAVELEEMEFIAELSEE